MPLPDLDFGSRTRVVSGAGSAERVGELARELGAKKVLLVTDAGIVAAGHAGRAQKNLEAAGLSVTVFDRAKENPTTKCVDDCVVVAQAAGIDFIVGLGGGSSMDTAKGGNFILTNGGRMQDYWGVGKATKPMLPFIAIPTTAGTGSEMQSAALIADEVTHQKMACLDPKCAACVAILDPVLTLSQPPRVTACTGIDAIAHAVETAVTTKRNELSQKLSREAFRLCITAFTEVLRQPDQLQARARMQLGAAYAGAAIEHSMLGAAHAAANPLTAHFGIVHGHAVGLMLPHVVRFNAADAVTREIYAELNPGERGVDELVKRLAQLVDLAGLPRTLAACGVERAALHMLAEEAAKQWTASFNPRPVGATDFLRLYEAAFG
ncbi:MAG: iron-containing alcohol dehydrogenase [Pedosphaera sp.]|nr:iron-containing alcohol dehydrogenase [Pedosphaera sp.]